MIGGNGAKKSTTLNAVAGVWPVDGGKIVIDDALMSPACRSTKRQVHRPCVPGSDDRHSRHHAD